MRTDERVEAPLCACGCGKPTSLNRRTRAFNRRLNGHSGGPRKRLQEVPCKGCGKPIYPVWPSGRPRAYCARGCWKANLRPYDKKARQTEWQLKNTYGITPERYESILASQGGGCAVCRRKTHGRGKHRLHVDHDHTTGAVRGILCASCNRGLGYFRDDPNRLRAAADYLEKEKG